MRLRLTNQTASEDPVDMAYPNLLSSDILVGMWLGRDYDRRWSTGPIILSRNELDEGKLARLASGINILRPRASRRIRA